MDLKMLWIYYIVGISHFTECRENRPDCMRNGNKSKIPYSASGKVIRRPYSGADHHQKLISFSD